MIKPAAIFLSHGGCYMLHGGFFSSCSLDYCVGQFLSKPLFFHTQLNEYWIDCKLSYQI